MNRNGRRWVFSILTVFEVLVAASVISLADEVVENSWGQTFDLGVFSLLGILSQSSARKTPRSKV